MRQRRREGKLADPVCGVRLHPYEVVATARYHGKVYYFCSHICKHAFEEDPCRYLKRGLYGDMLSGKGSHDEGGKTGLRV